MQKGNTVGSLQSSTLKEKSLLLLHGCFIKSDTLLAIWQLLIFDN